MLINFCLCISVNGFLLWIFQTYRFLFIDSAYKFLLWMFQTYRFPNSEYVCSCVSCRFDCIWKWSFYSRYAAEISKIISYTLLLIKVIPSHSNEAV